MKHLARTAHMLAWALTITTILAATGCLAPSPRRGSNDLSVYGGTPSPRNCGSS